MNDDEGERLPLYVRVQELPASCSPMTLVRHKGRTMIAISAWANRGDLLASLVDELTGEEFDYLAGELWPSGSVPLSWLAESGPIAVPESLWVTWVTPHL